MPQCSVNAKDLETKNATRCGVAFKNRIYRSFISCSLRASTAALTERVFSRAPRQSLRAWIAVLQVSLPEAQVSPPLRALQALSASRVLASLQPVSALQRA
jgi:hypothetical protein